MLPPLVLALLLLLVIQRLPLLRDYCFRFSCVAVLLPCGFDDLLCHFVFVAVAALPPCRMPLVPRALTGGRWPPLGAVKIQCIYWGVRQGCGHDVSKKLIPWAQGRSLSLTAR